MPNESAHLTFFELGLLPIISISISSSQVFCIRIDDSPTTTGLVVKGEGFPVQFVNEISDFWAPVLNEKFRSCRVDSLATQVLIYMAGLV